jgi:hypothetical protein
MKTIFTSICLLALSLFATQASAQGAAVQNINDALVSANHIKETIRDEKKAATTLTKQIVIFNNPNLTQFLNVMDPSHNVIIDETDNIYYFMSLAYAVSPTFNQVPVQTRLNDIVSVQDNVMLATQQIEDALLAGNNGAALTAISNLVNALNSQLTLINQVITRLNNIKNALPRTYDVCIITVDAQGNEVAASDLFGFYAINNGTGEALYPTNQEGTCFLELPSGNYTFDSFDGYFSGTGSTTVTLSDGLVNADGTIVVSLVYWSE